jgi:hypothetical protein
VVVTQRRRLRVAEPANAWVKVTKTDIATSNGVIHVIPNVVLPRSSGLLIHWNSSAAHGSPFSHLGVLCLGRA